MTPKPGHSAPIIAWPEVDRATCGHELAQQYSFRCPSCKGILRRCCLSVLSFPHLPGCPEEKWSGG